MVANRSEIVCIHHGSTKAEEDGAEEEANPRVVFVQASANKDDKSEDIEQLAEDDDKLPAVPVADEAKDNLQHTLEETVGENDVGDVTLAERLPTVCLAILHPLGEEAPHKPCDEVDHEAGKTDGDKRHVDEACVSQQPCPSAPGRDSRS